VCRASLVPPEQSVLSIPVRSPYDTFDGHAFDHAHAEHWLNVTCLKDATWHLKEKSALGKTPLRGLSFVLAGAVCSWQCQHSTAQRKTAQRKTTQCST